VEGESARPSVIVVDLRGQIACRWERQCCEEISENEIVDQSDFEQFRFAALDAE